MRKWLPPRLKRRLQGTTPYYVVTELRRALREMASFDRRVTTLEPDGKHIGRVLLSFINDPFFLKPGEPVSYAHTHDWESLQMAKTFLEIGYAVDVIRYSNSSFVPRKDYSILIDPRFNLQRMASLLNEDCLRIMHADAAHCLFHNAAEARRLLELRERRSVSLRPVRVMRHHVGIEHAHCATVLGNEFTMSTYEFAKKPMFRVPVSTPVLYPWPEAKNFDKVRKNFLWFGSAGLVHKGLDLVLDAFAGLPDHHLTICGPVGRGGLEDDFVEAFHKELYETPNIHTVGWIDVASSRFVEIANSCVGLVYPSCSEGGGASVLTCMHAGMIPLVSYESSVDIDDSFGVTFRNCAVAEIQQSIRTISDRPAPELERMARAGWEFARATHTKERFALEYKRVMKQIIQTYGKPL